MNSIDERELIDMARELLDLYNESSKALIEQGVMCRGLSFKQLSREIAGYTTRINSIQKRMKYANKTHIQGGRKRV